jgi:hypothetical protein
MENYFEDLFSENISIESLIELINEIILNLDIKSLIKKDRCSDVCRKIKFEIDKITNLEVKIISKCFDDFSDMVTNSPILFHHFLIVKSGYRSFLIDPTFGQFHCRQNIFIGEITWEQKNNCVKSLQKYNLPNKVLHFYCNEIVKEIY